MNKGRFNTFDDLLKKAQAECDDDKTLTNTIIKEILHYDILYALSQSELSRHLVFHGGTALRLCYQGNRYSEDLDFVTVSPQAMDHMEEFQNILIKVMQERYGLEVKFKPPKDLNIEGVSIVRWQAIVKIDREDKSLKRSHKINIEVADVMSYDHKPTVIHPKYDGLAPGFQNILLRASSIREIAADKVLAIASRMQIKSRDVWDMNFLLNRGIPLDMDMIRTKIDDYKQQDAFVSNMEGRIAEMRAPEYRGLYLEEMSRFVDPQLRNHLESSTELFQQTISNVANRMTQVVEAYNQGRNLEAAAPRRAGPTL